MPIQMNNYISTTASFVGSAFNWLSQNSITNNPYLRERQYVATGI